MLQHSDFYEKIFDFYLSRCKNTTDKVQLFGKFSRIHRNLEILSLVHNFSNKYPVALMDECILKQCSELVWAAEKKDKKAEELLLDSIFPSGFIIVDGPTDAMYQRFIKRSKRRVRCFNSNEYDDIRKKIDESLKYWRRLPEVLKSFSRPCIVLDATEPARKNADRVMEFLERFLTLPASTPVGSSSRIAFSTT